MACRLCTANDRDALREDLARELWDSQRAGSLDDRPWPVAGDYWQRVFRSYAAQALALMERQHQGGGR